MKFNIQQLEAINHIDGACAVIAGAGSGKSTVLVNRIKNMVESGIKEERILATTFTKNSALDLKDKLNKLGISNVVAGTFHSICGRILSNLGYDVRVEIKSYELENLFKKVLRIDKVDVDDITSYISYQKNYMRGYNDEFVFKDSEYDELELRMCYREYEKYKQVKKIMDYDDYLLECYKVLKVDNEMFKYDYILVDEHQDSNLVQNELIKLLCPSENIFCVFDYRQAIYTFRGGNPEYCMNFKHDYPNAKIINLDYNYRSTNTIVSKANRFIENYYGNYEFYSNSIASNNKSSNVETLYVDTKEDEARFVCDKVKSLLDKGVLGKDIAIIYRNNNQAMNVENEFKFNNIEYDIKDNGSFFKLKEIEIVLCMLRLIDNPSDDAAYEKLVYARVGPFKYLRNDTFNHVKKLASSKNMSFIDASDLVKVSNINQRRNLKMFSDCVSALTRQNRQGVGLERIIDNIIVLLDLDKYINEKYPTETAISERMSYLESLKKFIRSNTVDSFLRYVYCKNAIQSKKTSRDKVQMMTIHGSKGLEFKYVFVIGNENGKFPSSKAEEIDEARLFYVAITRAVEDMYITEVGRGSRFVDIYNGKK